MIKSFEKDRSAPALVLSLANAGFSIIHQHLAGRESTFLFSDNKAPDMSIFARR